MIDTVLVNHHMTLLLAMLIREHDPALAAKMAKQLQIMQTDPAMARRPAESRQAVSNLYSALSSIPATATSRPSAPGSAPADAPDWQALIAATKPKAD